MPTQANTPAAPHDWIPPGGGVHWTAIGEHGWQVVTLSQWLGERVLAELGPDSGAVIKDSLVRTMTWLIPEGAAAGFQLPDGADGCGYDDGMLFVPGMERERTLYWAVKPAPDRLLTDLARLLDALAVVREDIREQPRTDQPRTDQPRTDRPHAKWATS
ncbi:hypothetical protein [Streptomyces zagrosensis]|uniref:Uncharacterized protein n=1 Tax=Streptomyces zagrosensis TaxID=1042984 RepID=A0A7W9UYD7_9ACTN|nr:hypothetical protein [Streptomyces zagrosensis]MBB5935850.1 hypothetical protein [Streptomyces zagrosensis]